MGCKMSVLQCCTATDSKDKKSDDNTDIDANGDAKQAKKVEKKSKAKDKKKKDQDTSNGDVKEAKDTTESKTNGASKNGISKSGSAISTAKVRPLTPQNIPKPVAFDITLDANGVAPSEPETKKPDKDDKPKSMFPRRLPKLSSSVNNKNIEIKTTDDLIEKQKKAEEKRQEILEEKKQKARKFVEKFGNNKSMDENDGTESNTIEINNGEQSTVKNEIQNEIVINNEEPSNPNMIISDSSN